MESVFKCGNCGEVLTATAEVENGGCRVVFHILEHACFDGDQNHYIGNAWYGPYGALVCDVNIPEITNLFPMNDGSKRAYGAAFLVAETMTMKAAIILAKNLKLNFRGCINDGQMENI